MSSPHRNSDTEGHEKPVREQLRNASISVPDPRSHVRSTDEDAMADAESNQEEAKDRGRPSRKRSHEHLADETEQEPAHKSRNGRKRSRENDQGDTQSDNDAASSKRKSSEELPREVADTNGQKTNPAPQRHPSSNKRPATPADDEEKTLAGDHVASPKTKKSKPDESVTLTSAPKQEDRTATQDERNGKPSAEENKDDVPRPAGIPPTSGFANASSASPFSSLAGNKSPLKQTPTSSFQSSGFGALSNSSTSAFASLAGGAPKLSSFASSAIAPAKTAAEVAKTENDQPPVKTFGGALGASSPFTAAAASGASPFASASGSTFGKGGFGSGLGGGFGGLGASKLASFASNGTSGVIGGKSAKPFGASADDEGDEEGSGAEDEQGTNEIKLAEEEEKDDRFFEQEIETGEENETTEYTCRAKLYNFVKSEDGSKKEWKERGLGVVRLNVANPGPESADTAPKARLVMRADGSHRVVLNTPIVKGVKFGSVTGAPPTGGYCYFMGSIDGSAKLELLQMKLRPQFALELYERISDLQQAM